jgi:hypothetical protein
MDFDKGQFLTDVFEALVKAPGDPVRQIDGVIFRVIAAHSVTLHKLAQAHRQEFIEMAEERRATGKPVATKWKV